MPETKSLEYSPAAVQAVADESTRAALDFVASNRVEVVDLVTLTRAVEIRAAIADRQKAIASKFLSPKAWAFQLHRWMCQLEATALKPFGDLDSYERQQIANFKAAEDQRRAAEERLIAEHRRREMEMRATQEAAALEQQGDHELAEAVMAEAIAAPTPIVVLKDETKIKGLTFIRRYGWRYKVNQADAVKKLPLEYLQVDEDKMTAFAKAMKGSATLPGIEFYHVDDPVRR